MNEYTIAWPAVLLLIPLPWLARRYLTPRGHTQAGELRLPIKANWIPNQPQPTQATPKLDLVWLWMSYLLLIMALARPQILGPPQTTSQEGRDIMLAVDISGSMEEPDFVINGRRVDRLSAVKAIASRFILERPSDRIGLILFGTTPYLQSPLTFDHTSLSILLQEAFIGMAGPGTAIGDTINMAVKTLRDQPAESRVLILLTDGQNSPPLTAPEQALPFAQEIDLKIYTIGLGRKPSSFSLRRTPTFDEGTLVTIAEETKGRFFRAQDTEELREIYNIIDKLEKREDDQSFIRPSHDLFHWPLFGSVLMLLIYLSERHTHINWRPWRA